MRKVIILCGILCAFVTCNQLRAEFLPPNPADFSVLPQEDRTKLDSITENYSRAQQKASPIKQINNLRKKYAHNKEALTEIETAY
ncbi:MAG: hypothetical protein WC630_03755, partial [Candidatus Babeliales bacterium]